VFGTVEKRKKVVSVEIHELDAIAKGTSYQMRERQERLRLPVNWKGLIF
jgi:hypothetical protein